MIHFYLKRQRLQTSSWDVPALCRAYDWPTNMAGEGLIAIIELGGGYLQSDVDMFCSQYSVLTPTITNITVDGPGNDPGKSDADGEVALDIQVAAASYFVATGKAAAIRMYWTSDMSTAVQQAADDGCSVCSISWGADESEWSDKDISNLLAATSHAAEKGMLVFAAAGDNDSSDGQPPAANVDFPSSDPYVVACGGTRKELGSEVVWNNNPGQSSGEGTGGGYSTKYQSQAWQIDAPSPPAGLGRMVPDISANADPQTGYEVIIAGQMQPVGGTSAVAPLFAGLFASFGEQIGWCTDKMWANQQCFNDITQGDNGIYHAGPGPDPCSGIGSPKGAMLAALLKKP